MPNRSFSAESILKEYPRLMPDDLFTFRCGPDMDCFTTCCRDVSIVLTPYDVLRLRKAAGLGSTEFLERYTLPLLSSPQKLPVLILRMNPESKECPFLSPQGCGVYADRPWACRMYPLGVAAPKQPTPTDRPFHFVVHEQLCHGHGVGAACSVREYLAGQGIEEYEMMAAPFQEFTLHEFWDGGTALTPEQVAMFYLACYDLDRFRSFVFETRFLELFEVDEARVEALRNDDEELLEFGMHWLRFCLFGEKTMKIRREIREAWPRAETQPAVIGKED